MTLPASRNFTYANGDPPRHVDLNDIQDQIIAHDAELDDQVRGGTDVVSSYTGVPDATGSSWDVQLGGIILISGGAWRIPIPGRVGRRILSVSVRCKEDSGDTATVSVKKVQDASASTLGTPQTLASGSSWATKTVPDVNEVMDANHHYYLEVNPGGSWTGIGIVGQMTVVWDVP